MTSEPRTEAIRSYVKVAFMPEGTLRRASYFDGAFHDVHRMAMLRDEWTELVARATEGDRADA